MKKVTVRDARATLATILSETAFAKERYVLTRNGRDVVAIVPMEDLETIELLEDEMDLREIRKRLAKKQKPIPLADVKKALSR